ncbi:N-acetylmuramoyl-L-alanine amidase [Proteiniphilum propionicum]|jgi:N-acetylmuramoyl-L-alanine amidase|uniref:N-acetylmuramoyl-L-alanine amidase n=1 Tax=Proteiniphilum propionicum TaxID=2829812 RepID=UPI001EEA32A6|nr:N-acetylmuramoyl-L-alanine amidase [Proteiniphilum propionicum]ULB35623.1 N-acetylmuramoyl-L-alanine amidase [Proteiniphilum propionicum]
MRNISKIIIHCSATPEGRHHTVKDIDRWHRDRGFAQIGYHWVVYLDGSIHPGRNENIAGAHTVGHNSDSIGVCYIGGVDSNMNAKDTRTENQKIALRNLVNELLKKYPNATVHGHNEFAAKACPSFNVKTEL